MVEIAAGTKARIMTSISYLKLGLNIEHIKMVKYVVTEDLILGVEHNVTYRLYTIECTLEVYIILSTNMTPIILIKENYTLGSHMEQTSLTKTLLSYVLKLYSAVLSLLDAKMVEVREP